ncbi:hypothetical protein ATCV1_z448L [Acanthocystis turfacea chlorella virus 1]|uniref:Uncharacterized protein z448L n=1 Tax=Chlorovirus heliozoae TaxID=322019 RepID=A7K958_9PHYC|nr:hypothetical protein ATCV1_z448L [Acanthocystis turfacea chlorella virus 1]ABT16582.1 hypothetical protein ATCV1_z448L [Acanthocystis turfacea chlorella virus 1]
MDINVIVPLFTIGMAAIAIFIARKEVRKEQDAFEESEVKSAPVVPRLNNKGHEGGIDVVINILKRHGVYKKHTSLIDSMVLIVMSKKNKDCNLDLLIQADDQKVIEIGKMYIDRFAVGPTKLDYFLAGVIEMEVDNIRTGSDVPLQDIHEIRKTVDSFYYKNI